VRQAVIDVLARLVSSDEYVRKHFLLALQDENINTRIAEVNALSSLVQDDKNVRASILEMLNDSDIGIQQTAAAALGKVALDDEVVRRELSSFWARIAPNYLDIKARKFLKPQDSACAS
jgi:HEAT repeat protein